MRELRGQADDHEGEEYSDRQRHTGVLEYHITQLRAILAVCDPGRRQEELAVRILVGSGVRASELCGLAMQRPDRLPDLVLGILKVSNTM